MNGRSSRFRSRPLHSSLGGTNANVAGAWGSICTAASECHWCHNGFKAVGKVARTGERNETHYGTDLADRWWIVDSIE